MKLVKVLRVNHAYEYPTIAIDNDIANFLDKCGPHVKVILMSPDEDEIESDDDDDRIGAAIWSDEYQSISEENRKLKEQFGLLRKLAEISEGAITDALATLDSDPERARAFLKSAATRLKNKG